MVCPRFIAAALAAAALLPAHAQVERGRVLYETHCINCHTTGVHARDHREVENFQGLRQWVARWNVNLALGWGEEDILEVALYLNRRFYAFPCPADVCRMVSSAPAARVAH